MSAIMMVNINNNTTPPVVVSNNTMRSLLSPSGQTTYDATANDSWFSVTSADYAAVFAGLSGTSKLGMTDEQVTVASPSAFVGTYGITLPQAYSTVSSGNYIIGFVVRGFTAAAATLRPYVSTTFKGTYTTLGSNSVTTAATTNPVYYLRKNPASAQASTSYVAMGPRNSSGGNWSATGTWTGAGYSANMSSWTNWNSATPIQQWLVTTTQP